MIVLSWEDDAGAVVTVSLDVEEQETHELVNTPTDHEVEEGVDITDHIRREHDRFTLTGVVSDTPMLSNPGVSDIATFRDIELQIPPMPQQIGLGPALAAGIGALSNLITGGPVTPRAHMMTLSDVTSRKRAIFELLKDARDAARPTRIVTSMRDYENMQINQITVTRAPEDGNAAVFTLSYREVRTVTSELVLAPEPAEITGSVPVAAGAKAGSTDADTSERKKSLLKRFKDKIAGELGEGGALDGFL